MTSSAVALIIFGIVAVALLALILLANWWTGWRRHEETPANPSIERDEDTWII